MTFSINATSNTQPEIMSNLKRQSDFINHKIINVCLAKIRHVIASREFKVKSVYQNCNAWVAQYVKRLLCCEYYILTHRQFSNISHLQRYFKYHIFKKVFDHGSK